MDCRNGLQRAPSPRPGVALYTVPAADQLPSPASCTSVGCPARRCIRVVKEGRLQQADGPPWESAKPHVVLPVQGDTLLGQGSYLFDLAFGLSDLPIESCADSVQLLANRMLFPVQKDQGVMAEV